MRTHLHRWLPTVLALLALVVALGAPVEAKGKIKGSSIKAGTVTSKQLKDGSVSGVDVADGGLTGADVAARSLTGAHLRLDSIGSDTIAEDGVAAANLARNSVQGRALDASGFADLNFGTISASSCTNVSINVPAAAIADGTLLDDAVTVTPSSFFVGNFSYSAKTESATQIQVKMCNVSTSAADPDGGGSGKLWRYVAIDVD